MTTALICGVTGQDGAFLAQLLLSKGYTVWGTSRDSLAGHSMNLKRLGIDSRVTLLSMAPGDFRSILEAVDASSPDEIYNLAGQTSVGLSFEQPAHALESIAQATLNLLEVLRFLKRPIRFYNAGSSECFGDTGGQAANEGTAFRPRSPYAVAKSTAHWLVENYRAAYGMKACSGILFNHESALRPARFVTRKIIDAALDFANGRTALLRLGSLDVYRDWGWSPEYVQAMWLMLQADRPKDYVIATGQSYSLRDFVQTAFAAVGLDWQDHVVVDPALYRPSEIAYSRGDPSLAASELGWSASMAMPQVVRQMIEDIKVLRAVGLSSSDGEPGSQAPVSSQGPAGASDGKPP